MTTYVTGDSIASQKVPSRADVREGASKAGAAVARQASKYLLRSSWLEKLIDPCICFVAGCIPCLSNLQDEHVEVHIQLL